MSNDMVERVAGTLWSVPAPKSGGYTLVWSPERDALRVQQRLTVGEVIEKLREPSSPLFTHPVGRDTALSSNGKEGK